nr:hypothetical protein [Tanacetum cinerariifolium]
MVDDDDETSKDKEIDKLMALISLSFKKIYKPTNNNLRTSSNTSRANQDNSPRINKNVGYESQRNDAVDSGPIFDTEPEQKVHNDDHYDVFSIESNNKLSKTNNLLYTDFKKSQAELARQNSVEYASKVEIDCAKARGDLISYKMESQKSFNKYTQQINDLNQTISQMKKELSVHQETISILSQAKEAEIKLYKTHKDKELDKFIALENKVKVLDNIIYKPVNQFKQ